MLAQGSNNAHIRDKAVRGTTGTLGGIGGAWVDAITGTSVSSAVVGTNLDGKEVTATMVTTPDGYMNITYRYHTHEVDVRAGDLTWSAEALAFKKAFGLPEGGDGGLDEGMAKAFMNVLEQGE